MRSAVDRPRMAVCREPFRGEFDTTMALVEFRDVSYEIAGKPILADLNLQRRGGRNAGAAGPQRIGQNHRAQDDQRDAVPDAGTGAGGRPRDHGMGSDPAEAPHRLRDPGSRAVPAFHRAATTSAWFRSSKAGARRTSSSAWILLLEKVGMPPAEFRSRYPRQLSGRPAAASRRGARAGGRSAAAAVRRTVRRARSGDAAGIAAAVSGACGAISRRPRSS